MFFALSDFGHYVPKGYYTIDEDGNQSPIYFIESIPVSVVLHLNSQLNNFTLNFLGIIPS